MSWVSARTPSPPPPYLNCSWRAAEGSAQGAPKDLLTVHHGMHVVQDSPSDKVYTGSFVRLLVAEKLGGAILMVGNHDQMREKYRSLHRRQYLHLSTPAASSISHDITSSILD